MMSENRKLKIALVGCGAISVNHINGILASGNGIAALCDIVKEKAEEANEKYKLGAKVYTSYSEMLDSEKPDIVHICTPHYLHAGMIIEALGKNVNVLCEKPLCINEAELDAVCKTAAEAEKRHIVLGVCHQNRYESNMLKLRETAKIGVRAAYGTVLWKRDEKYYRSGEWRGRWDTEGGGVLINQALHTLDILQWVCGMPKSLTAHVSNDSHDRVIEVEDTATLYMKEPDGTTLHFFASTSASDDFPVQIRLVLADGSKVNAENRLFTVGNKATGSEEREDVVGKRVWGDGHRELIRDFYDCVRKGEKFPIDAVEAGKVVKLILAAYKSNGKEIEIN